MHEGGSGPNDIHRSGMKELQTVCITKEYKNTVCVEIDMDRF